MVVVQNEYSLSLYSRSSLSSMRVWYRSQRCKCTAMDSHTWKVCARYWYETKENEVITPPYSIQRGHFFPKLKLLNWILEEEEKEASTSFLRSIRAFPIPSSQKAQNKQHLTFFLFQSWKFLGVIIQLHHNHLRKCRKYTLPNCSLSDSIIDLWPHLGNTVRQLFPKCGLWNSNITIT